MKEKFFIAIALVLVLSAIAIPVAYLAKKDALHCLFDKNMMVCAELNESNKKGE